MSDVELEQEIKILAEIVQKHHFCDVQAIDESLAKIMAFKQASVIRPLIRLIEDDAEFDEAIFSVIHSIESFEVNIYISELALELPYIVVKSPQWAIILLKRILNNEHARNCLIEMVRFTTPEIKQSVLWLVKKINESNTLFLGKTEEVKIAAKC